MSPICGQKRRTWTPCCRTPNNFLRQTFGYTSLRNDPSQRQKADALLDATRAYARRLADMRGGVAELADSTGFSPEGVTRAMMGLRNLETRLTPSDWAPESLFGEGGRIADLYGVMLNVPQLKRQLDEIRGEGRGQMRISEITRDWVNGMAIDAIGRKHFNRENDDEGGTRAITDACRAIYRTIANCGTWGIAALSHVSGLDFDQDVRSRGPQDQCASGDDLPRRPHGRRGSDAHECRAS